MQRNSGTLDVPLPKPQAQKVNENAVLVIGCSKMCNTENKVHIYLIQ